MRIAHEQNQGFMGYNYVFKLPRDFQNVLPQSKIMRFNVSINFFYLYINCHLTALQQHCLILHNYSCIYCNFWIVKNNFCILNNLFTVCALGWLWLCIKRKYNNIIRDSEIEIPEGGCPRSNSTTADRYHSGLVREQLLIRKRRIEILQSLTTTVRIKMHQSQTAMVLLIMRHSQSTSSPDEGQQ